MLLSIWWVAGLPLGPGAGFRLPEERLEEKPGVAPFLVWELLPRYPRA